MISVVMPVILMSICSAVTPFGAGNLEVHVAEMILVADDVGQNRDAVRFLDEAHGDARDRGLQRNACIHHGQRSAADARHG